MSVSGESLEAFPNSVQQHPFLRPTHSPASRRGGLLNSDHAARDRPSSSYSAPSPKAVPGLVVITPLRWRPHVHGKGGLTAGKGLPHRHHPTGALGAVCGWNKRSGRCVIAFFPRIWLAPAFGIGPYPCPWPGSGHQAFETVCSLSAPHLSGQEPATMLPQFRPWLALSV